MVRQGSGGALIRQNRNNHGRAPESMAKCRNSAGSQTQS
jgi:hypothetical protein